MSDATSHALAAWVRRGGTLVSVPEAGCSDELGRRRSGCALWESLGFNAIPKGTVAVKRGKVVIADANQIARTVEAIATADTFRITPGSARRNYFRIKRGDKLLFI
jgi:hypothetical protein